MDNETWLIKAFMKTYSYSSLDRLLEDWWPVIGPNNSNKIESFNFVRNETYNFPCDFGGYVQIARKDTHR